MDLHLKGELVIIIGGGSEGLKKINSLLTQNCEIMLFSDTTNGQIDKYVRAKKIRFKKMTLKDADFLVKYKPYIVMATTNDRKLNRKIVQKAKKMRCVAYASDDPEVSDFAYPAIINIEDTIQVAISTGGKSPAMARKIKIEAEKIFKKVVKKEDILQIRLQQIAREQAKKKIDTQQQRRRFLYSVINDETVKQLIKNDDFKRAQTRINAMLRKWNEK